MMLEVAAINADGVDGERSLQLVSSTLQHEGQLTIMYYAKSDSWDCDNYSCVMSCNMGTRDLPDMYALSLRATGPRVHHNL